MIHFRRAPVAPIDEASAIFALQLIRSHRVGPATYQRLVDEHGSPEAAIAALPDIAAKAGAKAYTAFPHAMAAKEYRAGRRLGAQLLVRGHDPYPSWLAEIADAPPLLWARGRVELLARPGIALVGARNASSLGLRMARLLAQELGTEGYPVVSGLARGIDTAAHTNALPHGTIAVMAGGVDVTYPPENAGLAADMARRGLILSEQPIGMQPQARHFPRRNRIISGLAQAVVVVEGAAKSGSLITARDALDQGREVMAVPGHPLEHRASGCNQLIRDGALMVRSAADVMAALAPVEPAATPLRPKPGKKPQATPASQAALDISRRILTLLSASPVAEDQLIRDLDLPAKTVTPHLMSLELEGKLSRKAGGMVTTKG